ncbi:urokinase plasminogen activator surface receptor-like [Mugil cephalus]|uniref:urokinase plasminogen activator surface receptor-like n=1 Tax=Mugil cephalus TaxID=48193 RepID=UPI001FB83E29|nr:urokinase plasminogen activator surface receptor-like [Mugil cephalus]
MYLLTLVLGIVLLPEAFTLRCYECTSAQTGTCTETTKQCPSEKNQCAAQRLVSYAGSSKLLDVTGKSCAVSEECGELVIDYGVSRTVISSKCCNSDLCNTQPAPEPSKTNPNGKKCFSCNGQTCTTTLNCQGNEDRCISTIMNVGNEKVTLKGCASKAICTNMEFAQMTGAIGAEMSCCQGDYCNSASSTSAGLMLLVAPLISLVLS